MLSSAEIRWFMKGDIPSSLVNWFNNFDMPPVIQIPRTDHYLRLPDSESLGIKLREGRLEFKQRKGTAEKMHTAHGLEGILEYYQKWSFPADSNDATEETIVTYSDAWIGVKKIRSLHLYRMDKSGVPRAESEPGFVGNGCILELTNVTVKEAQENWWTLAFESFGDAELLESSLRATLALIADNYGIPDLDGAASCGYAEWMQKNNLMIK
jgi:hypothetical protein